VLLASPTNIRLGWKDLPGNNCSSLQTFVNYGRKKLYNIGPWSRFNETFFGINLLNFLEPALFHDNIEHVYDYDMVQLTEMSFFKKSFIRSSQQF